MSENPTNIEITETAPLEDNELRLNTSGFAGSRRLTDPEGIKVLSDDILLLMYRGRIESLKDSMVKVSISIGGMGELSREELQKRYQQLVSVLQIDVDELIVHRYQHEIERRLRIGRNLATALARARAKREGKDLSESLEKQTVTLGDPGT